MAVEAKRGCGYRKVGGTYLIGGILSAPCDRLPYKLDICPICGQGIKVGRAFTQINPLKAFGEHENCQDQVRPCIMCQPKDTVAFIMLVGEKFYSPQYFATEAMSMGVCKRIPFIPKELKLNETPIYLAHRKACIVNGNGETDRRGNIKLTDFATGIFAAFIPTKIEKLFWEKDLEGKKGEKLLKKLEKQGITPVAIPNGDKDHAQ